MSKSYGDSDLDSKNSLNSTTVVNDSHGRNSSALNGAGVPVGEKLAVRFEGKDFAASQLLDDAKRLASVLSQTKKLPVVILLPRGYWLYVSQLAVWLQGGFFVPIDTRNPISRIEFLLQDSLTQIVLTDQTNAARLANASDQIDIIDVEQTIASQLNSGMVATKGLDRIDLSSLIPHQDNDYVYMIYTSGSTGRPKGVPIHWRAMDNQYQWFVKEFGVGPHDHCMHCLLYTSPSPRD